MSTAASVTPSETRIGWIGTGVMGRFMAAHLISAGYSLTVFNRTPAKAQPLVSMGAHLADSPLAVARASHVVFLIVGYPSDVRHVALDPTTGVLAGLSPGSILVDMTTSDPSLAAEISSAAGRIGISSIDAPVSGGDRGAREGALSIFAGGEESVVKRLEPLFRCMGKVRYMGGPGAGQRAKLGNQIVIASTMVGLVEGMVFAHKAGLDVARWLEAISSGAAWTRSLDMYGKRILARDMEAGFYVHHFVKDLGICLKECQSMGLALPGLALAQQLYVSLVAHGEGGLGTQALILAVERLNNTCLKGGSVAAAAAAPASDLKMAMSCEYPLTSTPLMEPASSTGARTPTNCHLIFSNNQASLSYVAPPTHQSSLPTAPSPTCDQELNVDGYASPTIVLLGSDNDDKSCEIGEEHAHLNEPEKDRCVKEPEVGMVFGNLQDGYDYYSNYARNVGFRVRTRRSYKSRIENIKILGATLVCACEGFYTMVKPPKRKRQDKRFGCKAMIQFKLNKDKYIVTKFISEHSHKLVSKCSSDLIRSRKIEPSQIGNINKKQSSVLKKKKSFLTCAQKPEELNTLTL